MVKRQTYFGAVDMCDNVSDHLPVSICVNIPWNGISVLYNYQSDKLTFFVKRQPEQYLVDV